MTYKEALAQAKMQLIVELTIQPRKLAELYLPCGIVPGDRYDGVSGERVMDRALQSHRRAGVIRFADGKWRITELTLALEKAQKAHDERGKP